MQLVTMPPLTLGVRLDDLPDNDLYDIPAGALDLGETLTQTVQREVMEETGIAVKTTSMIGVYSDPDHVIAFTDGEARQELSICLPRRSHRRRAAHEQRVQRGHP